MNEVNECQHNSLFFVNRVFSLSRFDGFEVSTAAELEISAKNA